MPENDFVYAVARIRAKELSLLSAAFLEQLLALPDEAAGLKLLNEHGWGSAGQDAGTMLSEERRKTWALISELTGGQMEIFDVFRCENDYHNLKAAIKDSCSETHIPGIYVEDGMIPAQLIREAAESHCPTSRHSSHCPARQRAHHPQRQSNHDTDSPCSHKRRAHILPACCKFSPCPSTY